MHIHTLKILTHDHVIFFSFYKITYNYFLLRIKLITKINAYSYIENFHT
jgi:hypothetical protein